MVAELPVVLNVFIGQLRKLWFFGEDGDISSFGYCSIHNSSEKPAISIHIFSHNVAQTEARQNPESWVLNHASKRKTQVPTTKRNSFSPAGLLLCSEMSANTTDEQRLTL